MSRKDSRSGEGGRREEESDGLEVVRVRAERERGPHGPQGPLGGPERRDRQIGWRSRDILRLGLLLGGIWVLLRLLWYAHTLFFVAFLGILFGLALSGGVERLRGIGLPRPIGAVLIVLTFIGTLFGIGVLLAPTLSQQFIELREQLPAGIDRLEGWLARQQGSLLGSVMGEDDAAVQRPDVAPIEPEQADEEQRSLRDRLLGEMGNVAQFLFPFVTSTIAVFGGVLMILFIAIYIAVQPDLYLRGLMHLFPHRSRDRAREVLQKTADMLRRWLVAQLVAMVLVGAITTGVLMLLRVPAAVALGVIAGLFEFIPIFGPIIASIPAIAMALLESPQRAIIVAAAYVGIQQVESQLITPLLMKEGMDLPPVLTIVVQSTMAVVFGFIGLVVAVPLLGAAMVPIKMLYVRDVVGDPVTLPGEA